ncbi:fatty acid desaturase [Gottfriedia acidiceleris]|uniref:Fatty acid desaturase n=1 Tax=Gottfriedia acidiceleris TaxID=371036 RepID=A0ABY4JQU1_9BACI|nr:fatty acid desaturase [Gottfriedia acidiceleris]UPM56209.1 fatty acid desaturase [Gottfriedia acidiceleris]
MSKENQKSLRKQIIPYEKSNLKASIWQMINTFIPFIFLWYFAYKSISISVVLTIFIDIVAALFLIRIFIIFHDCCHQSFFKNKTANKVLGTITGVVTLFPFSQWKHSHSIHHATSGNLDKRGIGDMWVLTVEEYVEASLWTKIQYRLYRNPLIMFGLGPIYIVLITNRFNTKNAKLKERLNTYLTNILIVGGSALFCLTIGWENYLIVEGPIFFISAVLGIWLFYVQHQFEDTYFEEDANWEYVKAAVEGSSFYKLPKLLQWITGNIGYHHVHHLSPRVPNYNLESVHNNTLPLQSVPTITLKTSLTSLKFKLWNEETKQFVGFKDIKSIYKVNRESSDTV